MRTASSCITSAVGPSAISVPKSSTKTPARERLHHLDVVLDEQDRGAALAPGRPAACAPGPASRAWSRPDDGSSSSSSRGSVISARPTSTRRPRPRLSDSIGRSATSSSPSSSSVRPSASSSSRSAGRRLRQVLPEAPRRRARDRLGDEQVLAHGHAAEQLDALERAADARGAPAGGPATRVRSSPSKRDAAGVGTSSSPSRQLKNVVLPAPFGPDEPDGLARLDRRATTSSSAVMPAKRFAMPRASSRLTTTAPVGTAVDRSRLAAPAADGADRSTPLDEADDLALLRLEDPLGVPGVGERTEAEEDVLPLERRCRAPSAAPGMSTSANPATTAPSTVRALDGHDEHQPHEPEEGAKLAA